MTNPYFLRLIADNEQDRAECQRWWLESSTMEKQAVWDMIQCTSGDPVMEIVLRFAQLAFAETAEREGLGK